MPWIRILDGIRVVLVSPEAAAILGVLALRVLRPELLALLGTRLLGDPSILTSTLAIPGLLLAWATTQASKILSPASAAQNARLRAWPQYWRLKLRVLVGVFWIAASTLAILVLWIFRADFTASALGAGILAALLVSMCSSPSLWLASLTVREIVER